MLTRFVLWLLEQTRFLPLPLLRTCGSGLGGILYLLGRERRRVAHTNLQLCFPEMPETQRRHIARQHYRLLGISLLERGLLFSAAPARLERLIQLRGFEHLQTALTSGRPVILCTAHFTGGEAAFQCLTPKLRMATMYAKQKNREVDAWLIRGRSRFGDPLLLSRQDGVRKLLRALKAGMPIVYLPDMDFGPEDALFTPFFAATAATITGLSRLATLANAVVLPLVSRITAHGYTVDIQPPWPNFPGPSAEANTRRMNAWIEDEVRQDIAQYYWVHKRFKTRPPGMPRVY